MYYVTVCDKFVEKINKQTNKKTKLKKKNIQQNKAIPPLKKPHIIFNRKVIVQIKITGDFKSFNFMHETKIFTTINTFYA